MDDGNELRRRVHSWCLLAKQITDARALEAIDIEVARLQEQIGQLETKARGNQPEPGKLAGRAED
jgi:predicted  nucleic acid-binding Zn-ribbon protein